MASVGLGPGAVESAEVSQAKELKEEVDLEADIADVLGDMDDLLGDATPMGPGDDADFDLDDFDSSLLNDDEDVKL